jgi:hypothetical protein
MKAAVLSHTWDSFFFSNVSYCSSFKVLQAGAGAIDAEIVFFTDVSDHDTIHFTTTKRFS